LSKLSKESLFKVLGTPKSAELARLDGKPLDKGLPKQLVKSASWDDWIDEYDEDLRLLDLGEAFRQGAEPTTLAQPSNLRAPETIFTDTVDYRIDLWRAGIIVRVNRLPFEREKNLTCPLADLLILIQRDPSCRSWDRR
jgi:serine/threonine-protein kinase SRPK3